MSSKKKGNGKASRERAERPGVQVVLRVPAETKALLAKTAKDLRVRMNAAATERIATGRWPQKREGKKS
jgi:hypothetical protein